MDWSLSPTGQATAYDIASADIAFDILANVTCSLVMVLLSTCPEMNSLASISAQNEIMLMKSGAFL